jgi:hypothetical protein
MLPSNVVSVHLVGPKQAPVTQKMVLGVQIREPRAQSPVTRTRVRRPEIGRFGGQARIQYRSGCMRRLAQAREGVNQDCTATAQGGPLMAQVKTASAQVQKRNGHLVRLLLTMVYSVISGV